MGLLDVLNSDEGRMGLALLAAGAPRLDGAGFGQRLNEAVGSFDRFRMGKDEAALRKMQMEEGGLKLDQVRQQIADDQNMRGIAVEAAKQQGALGQPKPGLFGQYSDLANRAMAAGLVQKAQAYQELAEKYRPKFGHDPKVVMVNGKPVNVLVGDDGSVKTLEGYDVKPDLHEIDTGAGKQLIDYNTAQGGQTFAKTATPGELMADARARQSNALSAQRMNLEFGLDGAGRQNLDTVANAIANGQLPPPSGMALTNPRNQQILSRVMEINPKYDFTDVTAKRKAASDFATGKQGQMAQSLNVATEHLDTLGQLADALHNGDVKAFNVVSNAFAKQTGAPAPTNFDAVKHIVADEVVKAVVGAGGSLADRQEAAKPFLASNSPAQLRGAIQQYQSMMGGQLRGLEQTYKRTTGKDDFRDQFLSERTNTALDAKPSVTLSDIAATARSSGRTTAEVTAALKAKGYTIGGQ